MYEKLIEDLCKQSQRVAFNHTDDIHNESYLNHLGADTGAPSYLAALATKQLRHNNKVMAKIPIH